MTHFGVQLHGTFPMGEYAGLAHAVERFDAFTELTVHDVVWSRPLWPILTLVAEHTERVLVGPDVTHPYLVHPAVTAQSIAAIDELSGGRAVLGVGRGSFLEPLGIRRADSARRVRELVLEVRRILAGGALRWDPPRRDLPVFVGAFGAAMARSLEGGWAQEVRPPGIWRTEFLEHFRALVPAGVAVGCDVWVSIDADRERARELARAQLARFLPQMGAMTRFYGVDPAAPVTDAVLDTFFATGTPSDVERGLARLLDAAPATVVFSGRLGPDPRRSLDLLGAVVSGR